MASGSARIVAAASYDFMAATVTLRLPSGQSASTPSPETRSTRSATAHRPAIVELLVAGGDRSVQQLADELPIRRHPRLLEQGAGVRHRGVRGLSAPAGYRVGDDALDRTRQHRG